MDNSWQSQCGSMWQSSTPTPVASTQFQLQESLNQMLNAGHHFYPRIVQEPNSSGRGMMLEPSFTCTSNLNFYNSGHAELGNSFLSLLSGPPSLLQCDLQQLPNPKPFITSSKDPVNGSSAAGSGVSPTGLLSHNLDNWNLKTGVDLCPVVSSRAVASAYSGGASCLHDVLQAAHLNVQSSEHAKAVIHHNFNGIEKVKDFSPMRGRGLASPSPAHAGKLHSTSILASQKVPLETNSPVPCQSSPLTSGCPRVFCLGASGDLLLSNTGLLGVVCSCHGLHMSISKFSEHSGLRDVNPGDAVHMDNGETIAQWRKDYFHKFGIRVPEDHSGWNWPEGFSAAAGIASNSSRSSDLSKLGGPSGALVASGQQWNNNVISNNPHTGQKLVNEILHSEKPRTAQHSWNFFNSFSGTSQSNVHAVADNQIMDCPMSGCATVSKLVGLRGSDNGSQSISTYIDSISKSGSSFIPLPHLQNLKTSCKDSDVVRFNNLKVGDIVDRATISSNIELRLGQPSQQSQTLGNSIVPAFGSHVIGTHDHHPQKSLPLETLIPNRNYRAMEEGRKQYLQCAAGIPKSSTRREQRQFNIVNHSSGVYSAMDSAQTEQFRGDAARGSVISTLFSHLKRPAEGKMQPKATNNVVDGSHVIPGKLPCNSHILKYDPNNFLQNRGKGTETQFNVNELGIHKQMDIGKGVGCAADGAHVASESNFGFHTNYKGSLSSSSGVIGETGRYTCSVARNKSSQSYQLTEMPINASATRNPFNSVGKNSCLGRNGQLDHGFLRSVNFPMDSAPIFPSKAVSKEFSSTTSVSVPNQTPTLSANREGIDVSPYLLNENLRMLALRNMLELSNQDHAISSLGTSQEQRGFKNSRVDKIEGCIAGPSTSTERSLGFDLSSKQDASEVVMKSLKSGVTHWMSGDVKKLAPVADIEMQCQLSRDPHPNEQPLLRLGRSENDITPSNEHGKCGHQVPYAYFQGKCSCAVHTNCSGENCDFKGKTSLSAFQERAGSVGGRASMLFPSNLDGNCTFSKDKAISISQSGLLRMQNSKKVECHAFQWRDVPNKVTGICNVTCKDRPADLMDGRGSVEDQFAAAAKCFNRSAQGAESLKEQELSNISSGCSAPAITQASVKANNGDSCTVDARDSRRANNLVVDEGSGIDKCWSSDDALDSERSTEFKGFACKINSINKGSSKPFPNQSSRSLIDELRLRDSLRSKKTPNQIHTGLSNKEKTNHMQKTEGGFKTGKRKKATKWKMLDASFPTSGVSSGHNESPRCTTSSEQHSHSSKDVQMLLRPDQGRSHNCACSAEPSFKRRRSEMSSYKTISHKRNLHRLYDNREVEVDCQTQLSVDDNCLEVSEASHGKRFRSDRAAPTIEQVWRQEPNCSDDEITVKCNSVDCTRTSIQKVNVCKKKAKPVVCGKYGIISNGNTSKPAKILSIRKILKTARKCTLAKKDKLKLTKAKELKNIRNRGNNGCSNKFTNYKEERPREGQDGAAYGEVDPDDYAEKTAAVCFPGGKGHDDVSYMLEKERYDRSEKDHSIPDGCPSTGLKPKIKDVCKRSLNELTIKGKDSCCANIISMKNSNCVPKTKSSYLGKFIENAESGKSHASEVYDANKSTGYKLPSMSDLDAFCCVCGGSNKDEINCLLECNLCLIKVHQACYGVSKVPKAHWYCRPCRTSSKNIVCVLCGYGGGAMTRALQSHNIVKTLLKYWNFETEFVPKNPTSPTESLEDQLNIMPSSLSGPESDSLPVIRPVLKMDLQKHLDSSVKDSSYAPSNSMVHNSITAGVRDSTIKQWVHMVCGLWTPGTRCPNVDTMSSFDVSGASRPKVDVVCSICNRPGGSCIQCRVVDCSVQFHPWCAHQKGLLQSEVEGVDNENVGFYGRCELHATQHHCNSVSVPCDTGTGHPGEKELTCARTEGYKGRKREGFRHNIPRQSDGSSGCLVPQDQLNAWLHINGLKSCTKGPPKLPASDVEYDCRKEYARYKQLKGWKHLVVYKSGIHALGLYTSRFISRGAMVVEYVGEIVGLRVADKREIEYQSGRKLQYKSACYFFRIDKEHIIDATCKGGIARFVNHSCLVVFFAERDIYPGEEITYDYHFNNEDEGKKIPCFCNSKNCRRYLN